MTATYVPKFTYIIPFRYSPDRILPLKRVLEWLSGFQMVEIIIVELDKHSKIDYLNLKANHIFVEFDGPFNKCWAYNIGFKRANSPLVIFGDADYIMNPHELIEALKLTDQYECVLPTDKQVNLSPQQSAMDTASILKLTSSEMKGNAVDGISIFKRDAINKIAGWNESLFGLGYENIIQQMKINKHLNSKKMNYTGYHIFHQKQMQSPSIQERNKKIVETFIGDPNLLNQQIQQSMGRIGIKSGFLNV